MPSTSKASRLLPTLALILSILPTVLSLAIIAFAANGNWTFLILGGIAYLVSQLLGGIASVVMSVICLRRKWGRGRAITAVILSSFGLCITFELVWAFLIRGLI